MRIIRFSENYEASFIGCKITSRRWFLSLVYSFWIFPESVSFENALRTAVSLCGDCDTLTDITCAIAWPFHARSSLDASMGCLRDQALVAPWRPAKDRHPVERTLWRVQGNDEQYSNINDCSIVVRIIHGRNSFRFVSDAKWESEHDMVSSEYDLPATVLKVGYHGSDTSSSYVFLRKVMPKYVVIICVKGINNLKIVVEHNTSLNSKPLWNKQHRFLMVSILHIPSYVQRIVRKIRPGFRI